MLQIDFIFAIIYCLRCSLLANLKALRQRFQLGNLGSIPGLERSPGGGQGNPLQYSCLENPMDRGT